MTSGRPLIGLEEAFGVRARTLRALQRSMLALFGEAGYDEVIPPVLERPETLKSGAGRFLADQTLVFSDPADAGLLAVRPDMTPQIARIAATRLLSEDVLRLCYSGTVMLARPQSRRGSRQQWQTGVELLGVAGVDGDVEVMRLAAQCMRAAKFASPVLQIGHIGLLKSLVGKSAVPLEQWTELLARRSPDDIDRLAAGADLPADYRNALLEMASGSANADWLSRKTGINRDFDAAADALLAVAKRLGNENTGIDLQVNAAVMPRFLYHSGVVFSGFAANAPSALLHGGRYDAMMAAHGRDMAATGFSFDLWAWLDCGAGSEGQG